MIDSLVQWLDQISSIVLWSCVALLLLVNGVAAYAFFQTKSRDLVNRWTGRVLATNVLLIGAGAGVPAVAYVAKFAIESLAPTVTSRVTASEAARSNEANSMELVPARSPRP